MKKYDDYEQSEAVVPGGEALESLKPGGYICKILKVVVEEKPYGHLMRIGFDIAEGDYQSYFKAKHDYKLQYDPNAKWPGMYYQTIKEDQMKYFKGFMTSLEASNQGYKWDWDEKKLTGKLFGGIFGEEEFQMNDGTIGTSVKCMQIRSVGAIREGKFKVPELKKLNSSSPSTFQQVDASEHELPF